MNHHWGMALVLIITDKFRNVTWFLGSHPGQSRLIASYHSRDTLITGTGQSKDPTKARAGGVDFSAGGGYLLSSFEIGNSGGQRGS